jgi:hypothetical protein
MWTSSISHAEALYNDTCLNGLSGRRKSAIPTHWPVVELHGPSLKEVIKGYFDFATGGVRGSNHPLPTPPEINKISMVNS